MRIPGSIGAALALASLLTAPAIAQDEALQAEVEDLQSRYEQAWVAGDTDMLASLFSEDAALWPISGGSFDGHDEIRQALQDNPQPQAAEIRSTNTERMGDFVFDVGTFSVTLPEAQGGTNHGGRVRGCGGGDRRWPVDPPPRQLPASPATARAAIAGAIQGRT